MSKTKLLEFYALAVCFAATLILSIALGIGLYGGAKAAFPDVTVSGYQIQYLQDNDSFTRDWEEEKRHNAKAEEITKQRLAKIQDVILMEKRDGFQNIIGSSIYVFIALLLLIIHWTIARRARESDTFN